MYIPMFDRDLLYPTGNQHDPGSVHVTIMKPDNQGVIPIFIRPKSNHQPADYVDTLIEIIQNDVFDRAKIDVVTQGVFFFSVEENEFIKLWYQEGKRIIEKVNNIPVALKRV